MIPSFVKTPVSLAQQLAVGAVHVGVSGATAVLRRVLPGDGTSSETDSTQPAPRVSTEPMTQPPAPEPEPTPRATKTPADLSPATATPATVAAAKKATARKAPAKKAAPKKAAAKKATPSKPAATLDEPAAPVDDDPVVYSSGPDVAASLPVEDLEELRSEL